MVLMCSFRTGKGNRTLTPLSRHPTLNRARLPFRHPGAEERGRIELPQDSSPWLQLSKLAPYRSAISPRGRSPDDHVLLSRCSSIVSPPPSFSAHSRLPFGGSSFFSTRLIATILYAGPSFI